MPKDFIHETAITIDHEGGTMLVDTTQAGVASQLLRCGFTEITTTGGRPYRRFKGAADQLRLRGPKGNRKPSRTRQRIENSGSKPWDVCRNPAKISTIGARG